MTIKEKLDEIKNHPNASNSRGTIAVIEAIYNGVKLDEEESLFKVFNKAYQSGRHRSQCYIKRHFKDEMEYFKKELSNLTE